MKVLIIFLTVFLWTETLRASVIKRDELKIYPADGPLHTRSQKEKKKPNSKKIAQEEGEPLNAKDFHNAKFINISSPDYKPGEDPTLKAGLFEGDIAGINISDIKSPDRNAIIDVYRHWPNATIPYVISKAFDNKSRAVIARTMLEYHKKTCIRFVPKTSAHKNYVNFVASIGCHSEVGRMGGEQYMGLDATCFKFGILLHELMHAVGFYHEQSRPDRDNYITIVRKNIVKDMEHNFNKYNWSIVQSLGEPYDFGSIMHYGPFAFAKSWDKPTIIPKVKGKKIGQKKGFSDIDLRKINKLYKCGENKTGGNNCTDRGKLCVELAKIGECNKSPVYMRLYCMKTCGLCGGEACVDQIKSCPEWSSQGLCFSNAEDMKKICKKSCKVCT